MNKQLPPAVVIASVMIVIFLAVGLLASPPLKGAGEPLAGKRVENGPEVPDFEAKTADGATFKLSEHRGKVVLINFWATWCPPCVAEVPDLIRLQETYGPKGFTVVGVSQDESLEVAAAFAKDRGVNYPILLQPDGLSQKLGVQALPTSVLVDANGKLAWGMAGTMDGLSQYDVIGNELKRMLK
jgi:thiol-disulfide isomerase/thioredoxin